MNKKVFLILALLCAVAQGAWAESVTFRVRSWDDNNKQVVTTTETHDATVLEGEHPDDWVGLTNGYYLVKSDTKYKVLNIMGDNVHLILSGGAKLHCIHVKLEMPNKLHIHDMADDNTGTLEVVNAAIYYSSAGTGGAGRTTVKQRLGIYDEAAAIGSGGDYTSMGGLYVHGGTVDVDQAGKGAGIGGGKKAGIGDKVAVFGGVVKALVYSHDDSLGAAIGGGYKHNQDGPVTIYGGKVTAISGYGSMSGAGIGGGALANGGKVTIWGGEVLALGGVYSPAIGGGYKGSGGDVHILGGTVEARGGEGCSAIGSYGDNALGTVEFADNMRVTGGSAEWEKDVYTVTPNIERVFTSGDREAACQWRNWVKVEACDHKTPTKGSDKTDPITYSIDDEIYHTKHCRYCNTTWEEAHNNGAECVCGKISFYRFTVHHPDTEKDKYDESSTIAIALGMDFYLPGCKNVPDGYTFKGWEMNPENVGSWAAVRGGDPGTDTNMPAGTSVKTHLGQDKEVHFYARFLYDFTPTWTWNDDGPSASVTLSHKDLNDVTLSSTDATPKVTIESADLMETVTIVNNDETTSEQEVKIGTRYTATCTYELNGYEYTFTDTYDILDVPVTVDISLQDNADNSETISEKYNCPVNATLAGRTLYKDGSWNTLCLPFDLVLEGSPLAGATVKTLESSDYDILTGELTLNFTTGSLTALSAGTPYLVKWESGENLVNPVFSGVTVSTIGGGHADTHYVDFVGSFSPVSLTANDKTVLYLGADNKLYYPSQNRTMGSCRAVFRLHNGLAVGDLPTSGQANAHAFVLNFGDGEATGIVDAEADSSLFILHSSLKEGWYDLQGRRLNGKPTEKGIYINNGIKVVIK